jgi:hypothetical protein
MKLKKIEPTTFTSEDEENLKKVLSTHCNRKNLYAISTQGLDLPFRAFYLNSETPILLINPVITQYSNQTINSQEISEFDNVNKSRIVPRAVSIYVQCDNLGLVSFAGDGEDNKQGLDECIFAQQMIDLLDGITIADRNINLPIRKNVNFERNQLVMAKSPQGMIEQIKYKHIQKYIDKGYIMM